MSLISLNIHRAAEEDVDAQRQELMAGFDDAQRKREHEFRRKADDLSNSLLASELKVRVVVFVLHGQSFLATHDILRVPFFRRSLLGIIRCNMYMYNFKDEKILRTAKIE